MGYEWLEYCRECINVVRLCVIALYAMFMRVKSHALAAAHIPIGVCMSAQLKWLHRLSVKLEKDTDVENIANLNVIFLFIQFVQCMVLFHLNIWVCSYE